MPPQLIGFDDERVQAAWVEEVCRRGAGVGRAVLFDLRLPGAEPDLRWRYWGPRPRHVNCRCEIRRVDEEGGEQ